MSGLMLLANDPPSMLVPKTKPRDTNSIFYYYLYSVNVLNHLLIAIKLQISKHFRFFETLWVYFGGIWIKDVHSTVRLCLYNVHNSIRMLIHIHGPK